jgi:hypothetical protein
MYQLSTNLGETFNVSDVPQPEYGDLPDGKYLVVITESQLKPERNNENNIRASLQLTIQEGELAGRVVFANPCWINVREDLQLYGRQELSQVIKATGLVGVSDLTELHDKFFHVTLKTKPGKDGTPRQNKTYQKMVTAAPTAAPKPSAFQPQPRALQTRATLAHPQQAAPPRQIVRPTDLPF